MTLAELRESRLYWRRKEKAAKRIYLDESRPNAERKLAREDYQRARDRRVKRDQQIAARTDKPRIVPSGVRTAPVFGALGPELRVTTHYAASPRAEDLAEGLRLARQFDNSHRGKGWGGLSYHYLIPDSGEIILGRPLDQKGAGVAYTNSNNVHVNFFCTTGHQPTQKQREAIQWLIANAHTSALPKSHRTDRDLRKADIRGHNQWHGQTTACPGNFTPQRLGLR